MFVIKYKAVFFTLSALLVLGSLFSLYQYGLNFGTDFKGGTIMELNYVTTRPEAAVIKETLEPFNLGSVSVQPAGTNSVILRFGTINEDTHNIVLKSLVGNNSGITETRYSSIGPSLGKELARKGMIALGVAVLFIIIYIAIAFRS